MGWLRPGLHAFLGTAGATAPGRHSQHARLGDAEAYSHECISAGWWPGNEQLPEPAFYAYIYPEPVAFPNATVRPAGAYYHEQLHEFVLPYDVVRNSAHPELTLLTFLQSTYAAAADLAGWPRAALEARRLTARERL